MKAKGEQSILYLIWHLFTRLSGSRVIAHSKKNQLTLARWQERQSCDDIPRNRYDSMLSFVLFFFRLQSAEDGARETKSVRDTQCANPNVLSKISDREKKEERILSADDDIFYALLNSLFRELFFPLLWFVLLLRLKTGRRELDGGRCERWRGLLAR